MNNLRLVNAITRMAFANFIARQSARPYGRFGRLIFGRLLNRANAPVNRLVYDSLRHDAKSQVAAVGCDFNRSMQHID